MPYDPTLMTEEHRQVWDWLVSHCAGRDNAKPRVEILMSYNTFHVCKLTDRKFRQLVSDLVLHFHLPVCPTSADGYYVARYQSELNHGIAELKARALAILERQHALEQAWPLEPQEKLL
jgi:hypothetical protein